MRGIVPFGLAFFGALTWLCLSSVGATTNSEASGNLPGPVAWMSFDDWKSDLVRHRQNHVVRLSNHIHLLKQKHFTAQASSVDLAALTPEVRQAELARAEVELKAALEGLQYAKELGISDYVTLFVVPQRSNPDFIMRMVKGAPREELVQVIQILSQQIPTAIAILEKPTSKPNLDLPDSNLQPVNF